MSSYVPRPKRFPGRPRKDGTPPGSPRLTLPPQTTAPPCITRLTDEQLEAVKQLLTPEGYQLHLAKLAYGVAEYGNETVHPRDRLKATHELGLVLGFISDAPNTAIQINQSSGIETIPNGRGPGEWMPTPYSDPEPEPLPADTSPIPLPDDAEEIINLMGVG